MADKSKTPAAATTADAGAEAKKTPRERFESTGVNRVNNVIKSLEILENVSDRNTYSYTDAEVAKIMGTIDTALSVVKKRFADALAGKVNKPVKSGFSL